MQIKQDSTMVCQLVVPVVVVLAGISSQFMPVGTTGKKRMNLLVCKNASGSENIPLMYIDNAMKTRCFKKQNHS